MREASTRDICPAPMPSVRSRRGIDDRVGFHVFHHAPGKDASPPSRPSSAGRSRHDFAFQFRDLGRVLDVAALHQHAADDARGCPSSPGTASPGTASLRISRRFFFFCRSARASGSKSGAMITSRKNLADRARQRLGERPVADDDAAKRRLLVGRERLVPCLAQVRVAADAARIGVLQNGDRRLA